MNEKSHAGASAPPSVAGQGSGERRLLGTLRDALAAASRSAPPDASPQHVPVEIAVIAPPPAPPHRDQEPPPVPEPQARETRVRPPRNEIVHIEVDEPLTKVVRAPSASGAPPARTQLVRGKAPMKRTEFHQDPVVGWLVVVGGAGLGAFRPIFEGNNTMGRSPGQRIPIDFGDESISAEEQAYIRYDSVDRRFLLVPNLAKTNIVAVNDRKPTGAIELAAMDLITMGRTQLVFVPFCGSEFDWTELSEMKG